MVDGDDAAAKEDGYKQSTGWQLAVWKVMDDPSSGKIAKMWSLFMMFVILYSILNFTLSSIPGGLVLFDVWSNISTGNVVAFSTEGDFTGDGDGMFRTDGTQQAAYEEEPYREPYRGLEIFCIATFTFEFMVRLVTCPASVGIVKFLKSPLNIVDFISIVPFYLEAFLSLGGDTGGSNLGFLQILRLIRLTRIARIFKMSKNFEGLIVLSKTLAKSAAALAMLMFFLAVFSVLFATLIYTVELGEYDPARSQFVREDGSASPFESIPASCWWTIITMTTVGFGDHYPVSGWGRLVAVITMTVALIVLSLPITIIGANFDEEYNEMRQRKAAADMAALEAKARALTDANSKPHKTASLKTMGEMTKIGAVFGGAKGKAGDVKGGGAEVVSRATIKTPLRDIDRLINNAHVELSREVEMLMEKQEVELRNQIQNILRQCAGYEMAE